MTLTLLNVYVQDKAMKDQLFVKERIIEDLRVVRERLHHQAQDIEVSLKKAESEYNCLINQMAPLHSLPDEILANIFEVGHATLNNFSYELEIVLNMLNNLIHNGRFQQA